MMKAGYDYGFVVPSELLLHAKALTTAESLIFVLDSDARFEKLSCPFIAREYAARISSLTRLKKRVSQLAPELLLVGEFLPPEAVDETGDWNATVDLLTKMRTHFGGAVQSSLERGGLRQTLVEPHARMALKATPIGELTGKILSEAWDRHYELEPSLAIEPTIQAIFTTHLAVATLVLHEVLLRQGNSANESHRLIWDIGWKIYVQMAKSRCMSQAR
jgi:ubiquinone biosynthesis protein